MVIISINMVDISRKTFEKNGVETIVDSDEILQLHENIQIKDQFINICQRLQCYLSNHRKYRYELVDKPKKQPNRFFISNELANKVIIDCRTTAAHIFKVKLGFKPYYNIQTKEQPVLAKTKSSFGGENAQT